MRFLVGVFCLITCVASSWDRAGAQPAKKEITLIEGITSADFGYVPSYIARAKGFLANEGVELKIVVMRASLHHCVSNTYYGQWPKEKAPVSGLESPAIARNGLAANAESGAHWLHYIMWG